MAKKPAEDPEAPYRDGSFLRYYRAVNETHRDYLVYELGPRGFYAEISSVARAMIWAWQHRLQFALGSKHFAYRCRDGWSDYFQPFCRDACEVPEERVHDCFRFENRAGLGELRAFAPASVRFGTRAFTRPVPQIAHFMRLIFRLSYDSGRAVVRLRETLRLPEDYVALHIRRGDKVGDEDVQYPVERYFRRLHEIGGLDARALFVMSDDYATVDEVRTYLESTGQTNRVVTLCQREHTGFSVNKLQRGEDFTGPGRHFENAESYRSYVRTEVDRLLAETLIATAASRLVTTRRSNVGRTIRALRPDESTSGVLG